MEFRKSINIFFLFFLAIRTNNKRKNTFDDVFVLDGDEILTTQMSILSIEQVR
jgi:hypothetical protein